MRSDNSHIKSRIYYNLDLGGKTKMFRLDDVPGVFHVELVVPAGNVVLEIIPQLRRGSRKKSYFINGNSFLPCPLELNGRRNFFFEKKVHKKVLFFLMAGPLTPPPPSQWQGH